MGRILGVGSVPLFSLMLAFDSATPLLPFEAASLVNSPAIRWLSLDTSKPVRPSPSRPVSSCWTPPAPSGPTPFRNTSSPVCAFPPPAVLSMTVMSKLLECDTHYVTE